ncbi:MAG: ABC transporter permease [Halomonadaceae bacterium]|nr:MAG: ABC transporter permease [Halomonadaceae bacterium]
MDTVMRYTKPISDFVQQRLPAFSLQGVLRTLGMPIIGIAVFLMLWQLASQNVDTAVGSLPGPAQVWQQSGNLWADYQEEQQRARDFIAMQEARNAQLLERNPEAETRIRPYSGQPTFFHQIGTSLMTVMSGFLLASLVAIPLGILVGLNRHLYAAINPLIQVFKPVSPLAWLPIVTLVVSATYVSDDPMFSRSFVTSVITVSLCSLWPTLINTMMGVNSVSQDLRNVSQVLRLPFLTHVRRVVLPSAIPMIFTGMRLSLGIAWMVLIAAEMLAQNPGLGKFIWDEFQNGSSSSLSRIMVAVIAIGVIGLLLDRTMLMLQRALSWDKSASTQ